MKKYDFKKVEEKWQREWQKNGVYEPKLKGSGKRKPFYNLMMFPYPSAEGLHVGNMYAFTGSDVYGRFKRMQGFDVFEPIGLDGFGIHSENYALKVGTHPMKQAAISEKRFYKQLQSIGSGFAWNERLETYNPDYYRWTQWIFVAMFRAGLAYRKKQAVNWCPSCKTVLADEQVIAGKCERCGSVVEKRELEQWFFRITNYAERLLQNLDRLDWTEKVKIAQRNWIGKSEGAEIDFPLESPLGGATEVVFASSNQGKLKRMQRLFKAAGLSVTLKTPAEAGIKDFEVEETGATLRENAEKKARALAARTKLPVLADDSGFFIEGEIIDPVKVKRNALKGLDEKNLTIEQIGKKMQAFYQDIAAAKGGSIEAAWHNQLCLIVPGGKTLHAEAIRPVMLMSKARGKADPYLPLRPVYVSKATGKYVLEQTAAEELKEMEPITRAIKDLIAPSVKVFTTRPDTLFGATYVVLAPEHSLIDTLLPRASNRSRVEEYVYAAKNRSEEERIAENREKTGAELKGVNAINPATGAKIPVWVADYVLGGYGTGAIMAVPAHDDRDYAFAKQFDLPIKQVILNDVLINSGSFNGLDPAKAKWEVARSVGGKKVTQYRLRDWLISRQRYWGAPIPMIYCQSCAANGKGERKDMPGWYAEKEKNLPVVLPLVKDFRPKGTGESPLASVKSFYEVKCPACKSRARRETDVSDTFLDSAWYYLRYPNVREKDRPWDPAAIKKWFPVDMYIGGAEHSVLHLLYVRFITLLLNDLGLIKFGATKGAPAGEPFPHFRAHGLVIKDGAKMSKSKGNVINPDEYIAKFSADVLRMYLMFLAPFEQGGDFRDEGILGVERFLAGVRRYFDERRDAKHSRSPEQAKKALHKAIKKVGEDIESLKYNTAISQLMILFNALDAVKGEGYLSDQDAGAALKLIAPFAPHLTEELWHSALGQKHSIHVALWPEWDAKLVKDETFTLVIQVNGKVRATVEAPTGISEEEAHELAMSQERILETLNGSVPRRVIYIPGRLVNVVV